MKKIIIKKIEKKDKTFLNYLLSNNFVLFSNKKTKLSLKKINLFIINNKKKLKIIVSDNIRIGAQIYLNSKKYFILSSVFLNISDFDYHNFIKLLSKNKLNKRKLLFLYKDKYDLIQTKNLIQPRMGLHNKNKIIFKKILILGPKKRNYKIIQFLQSKKIKVLNTTKIIKAIDLKKNGIQAIISSGYAYKISEEIVKQYKYKIFNLHATFLPWGKGIGTTFYSFLLDQPVGISIHLIDKEFDTGDILVRKKITPLRNDTTRTFYQKLLKELDILFFNNFEIIFSGQYITYKQKTVLKKNQPYFSRLDFEKIFMSLPLGYDTFLYQLALLSYIKKLNNTFKNKFL